MSRPAKKTPPDIANATTKALVTAGLVDDYNKLGAIQGIICTVLTEYWPTRKAKAKKDGAPTP